VCCGRWGPWVVDYDRRCMRRAVSLMTHGCCSWTRPLSWRSAAAILNYRRKRRTARKTNVGNTIEMMWAPTALNCSARRPPSKLQGIISAARAPTTGLAKTVGRTTRTVQNMTRAQQKIERRAQQRRSTPQPSPPTVSYFSVSSSHPPRQNHLCCNPLSCNHRTDLGGDFWKTGTNPWPAPVALLVASRFALPAGYGDRRVWVQGQGWRDHLCQVIEAYALRLNSRAGTEGSTASSLNCDTWLILGLEHSVISPCLNHW